MSIKTLALAIIGTLLASGVTAKAETDMMKLSSDDMHTLCSQSDGSIRCERLFHYLYFEGGRSKVFCAPEDAPEVLWPYFDAAYKKHPRRPPVTGVTVAMMGFVDAWPCEEKTGGAEMITVADESGCAAPPHLPNITCVPFTDELFASLRRKTKAEVAAILKIKEDNVMHVIGNSARDDATGVLNIIFQNDRAYVIFAAVDNLEPQGHNPLDYIWNENDLAHPGRCEYICSDLPNSMEQRCTK